MPARTVEHLTGEECGAWEMDCFTAACKQAYSSSETDTSFPPPRLLPANTTPRKVQGKEQVKPCVLGRTLRSLIKPLRSDFFQHCY